MLIPPPRRILVVRNEPTPGTVRAQQFEPLRRHARRLHARLGLAFEDACAPALDAIERAVSDYDGDVALVMVRHDHDPAAVRAMFERLRARRPRPAIVFHDAFDQSCSLFWESLPFADRYAKKILLRDLDAYRSPMRGGFVLSDFLARELGFEFPDGWRAGVAMPPEADAGKVVRTWTFAAAAHYARLERASRWLAPRMARRRIDVSGRFAGLEGAPHDWYQRYRGMAADAMAALARQGVRLGDARRVGPRRYAWDLMHGRLVFSPFGYGEVCLRDVEAIACGAVLVKPSVEHLVMSGDLFEPGVTYLPVRWDFADLGDRVADGLRDPARLDEIARAARERLRRYIGSGWIDDVERTFAGLARLD